MIAEARKRAVKITQMTAVVPTQVADLGLCNQAYDCAKKISITCSCDPDLMTRLEGFRTSSDPLPLYADCHKCLEGTFMLCVRQKLELMEARAVPCA